MSWLWIYITLMEWVGIVLVVKALGDEQYHIEPKMSDGTLWEVHTAL